MIGLHNHHRQAIFAAVLMLVTAISVLNFLFRLIPFNSGLLLRDYKLSYNYSPP